LSLGGGGCGEGVVEVVAVWLAAVVSSFVGWGVGWCSEVVAVSGGVVRGRPVTDIDTIRDGFSWIMEGMEVIDPLNAALDRVAARIAELERDLAVMGEKVNHLAPLFADSEAKVAALKKALRLGVEVVASYYDTDRGDVDGWLDVARAALAEAGEEA
jgi:hypothetical protein